MCGICCDNLNPTLNIFGHFLLKNTAPEDCNVCINVDWCTYVYEQIPPNNTWSYIVFNVTPHYATLPSSPVEMADHQLSPECW